MIEKLTPQERQVLAEMGRGGRNREIANRIEKSTGYRISENQISVCIYRMGKKLNLHDRTSIALFAMQMEAIALLPERQDNGTLD